MATITINLADVRADVDRRILSGFAEHLGRCIYGGIYDEASPLADEQGLRKDVIEAVRRLRPPVLRWPGGNFVSGYHWSDGIGPKSSRPRRMELAWHAEEPNRFGTDEFLAFCKAVGAEPYICLNMGTGTIDEAQAWVEYCNGRGSTEWAERRRGNGHEIPYGVRYWGLGNEVYGPWQIGQMSAQDYVKTARQWAKVLTWTDPAIELVSCGETGWSDWDEVTIAGLAEFVRWHSIHLYTGSDDYWANVLSPHQAERAIRIAGALIEKARYNQRISHSVHIAFDEWNVWFRERSGISGLEERYTLGDALAVATYLHAFVRCADVVKMANLAQLVNVIAPIVTREDGLFLQTIYHPLRLFGDYLGTSAMSTHVESERHEFTEPPTDDPRLHRIADLGPFPVLDAVATRSGGDGPLMLSVINRSPDTDVTAQVDVNGPYVPGPARVEEVNGPSWDTMNSFENPESVSTQTADIKTFAGGRTYRFPAHSHTVIVTQPAESA
jgi:alpha-N-arabinofuranosidase